MKSVLYSTDGHGTWTKTTWADQCDHKVFMGRRCQGVAGHDGDHWCYDPSGRLLRDHLDGSSSSTPPDHRDYVPPVGMVPHHYSQARTTEPVTDPALVARLERGEIRDGESITRPVRDDEVWP